jgi:hypothetical protein
VDAVGVIQVNTITSILKCYITYVTSIISYLIVCNDRSSQVAGLLPEDGQAGAADVDTVVAILVNLVGEDVVAPRPKVENTVARVVIYIIVDYRVVATAAV